MSQNPHVAMTSANQNPLTVALSAQRPLPVNAEPLEVERLLSDDHRRITIDDHQRFRESITRPTAVFDEIDMAVDPLLLDRPPQRKSDRDASRVLSILDELERRGR